MEQQNRSRVLGEPPRRSNTGVSELTHSSGQDSFFTNTAYTDFSEEEDESEESKRANTAITLLERYVNDYALDYFNPAQFDKYYLSWYYKPLSGVAIFLDAKGDHINSLNGLPVSLKNHLERFKAKLEAELKGCGHQKIAFAPLDLCPGRTFKSSTQAVVNLLNDIGPLFYQLACLSIDKKKQNNQMVWETLQKFFQGKEAVPLNLFDELLFAIGHEEAKEEGGKLQKSITYCSNEFTLPFIKAENLEPLKTEYEKRVKTYTENPIVSSEKSALLLYFFTSLQREIHALCKKKSLTVIDLERGRYLAQIVQQFGQKAANDQNDLFKESCFLIKDLKQDVKNLCQRFSIQSKNRIHQWCHKTSASLSEVFNQSCLQDLSALQTIIADSRTQWEEQNRLLFEYQKLFVLANHQNFIGMSVAMTDTIETLLDILQKPESGLNNMVSSVQTINTGIALISYINVLIKVLQQPFFSDKHNEISEYMQRFCNMLVIHYGRKENAMPSVAREEDADLVKEKTAFYNFCKTLMKEYREILRSSNAANRRGPGRPYGRANTM